jgi:microcystin-dependent protein
MDFYLSMIVMWGLNFAPRGWAMCNGQLLSIAQNTALFSLLGTTFGGDGMTTFALPDFRGRAPMNWGNGPGLTPRSLGEQGGSESTTLNVSQMPAHTHAATAVSTLYAETAASTVRNPAGNMFGTPTAPIFAAPDPAANRAMGPDSVQTAVTVQVAGGSQPVAIMQPFLAVTFCICTEGIFPSRN